jgi:transcriptional regulator with PAS, ATPase and Fis domain
VDVRIIAATNVPLDEMVKSGRMREDIYFRLSEVIIRMPALRERPEDIPLLAEHFNYNYCGKLGKAYQAIPGPLVTEMQRLNWPGNVRELSGRVKKYVATGNSRMLLEEERPVVAAPLPVEEIEEETPVRVAVPKPRKESPAKKFMSLKEATRRAVESTERALIEEALRYTLWNRRKAAQLLDISYSSLLRRIDAYNIGKSDGE